MDQMKFACCCWMRVVRRRERGGGRWNNEEYGQAGDLGQRGWKRGERQLEQRRVWPLFVKLESCLMTIAEDIKS